MSQEPATVLHPSEIGDAERRELLYRGHILLFEPSPATLRLRDRAFELFRSAFPVAADWSDPAALPDFQRAATLAKAAVGGDPAAAGLLSDVLTSLGCDPARTYRHRLFLRTVPPLGQLGARAPYHAAPHRDSWLSAPPSQVNWWMPVSEICAESGLMFYPAAWGRAVANDSHDFDYLTYKARFARIHRTAEVEAPAVREAVAHPRAVEPIPEAAGVRIHAEPGALIAFSAAHLHGSVPNTSGKVRVSVDFRTCNVDDLIAERGPESVDVFCAGSNLVDFARLADGAALTLP